MPRACQTCNAQIADGARFCSTCGMPAPLGDVHPGAEAHRGPGSPPQYDPAPTVGGGHSGTGWPPAPEGFAAGLSFPQNSYLDPYQQQQPNYQSGAAGYPPASSAHQTGQFDAYGMANSGVPLPPPGGAAFAAPPRPAGTQSRLPLILLTAGLTFALIAGGLVFALRGGDTNATDGADPSGTPTQPETAGGATGIGTSGVETTVAGIPAVPPPPDPTTEAFTPCPAQVASPVQFGGRHALLHSPNVAGTRAPAIVVLDGSSGAPELIENYSKVGSRLSARGVIVVEPAGTSTGTTSADGIPLFNWAIGPDARLSSGSPTAADVDAISAVVRSLVTQHCADPSRIMIAGLSAGATAALRVACAIDPAAAGFDGFTAIAMVAPAVTAAMLSGDSVFTCSNAETFDVLAVTGTADSIVPGAGGGRFDALPMSQWLTSVVGPTLGCNAAPTGPYVPGPEPAPQPPACGSGRVLLLTVDGLGHAWPGGEPVGFSSQALPLDQFLATRPNLTPTSWDFTSYLFDLFERSW